MPDDVTQKIKNWLQGHGYPLEMRVTREFQQAEFLTTQSDYYADPESESGTYREIDVVASVPLLDDPQLRVSLAIECKRSADKPWLLFTPTTRPLKAAAQVVERPASDLMRTVLARSARSRSVQQSALFTIPEDAAYGMVRAFEDGKDVAYTAAMAAAKASVALVREWEDWARDRPEPSGVLVLPTVVLDAKLYKVSLNPSSDLDVIETQSAILLWRNPAAGVAHTIINITTLADLPSFVRMTRTAVKQLGRMVAFREHATAVASEWRHDHPPPLPPLE